MYNIHNVVYSSSSPKYIIFSQIQSDIGMCFLTLMCRFLNNVHNSFAHICSKFDLFYVHRRKIIKWLIHTVGPYREIQTVIIPKKSGCENGMCIFWAYIEH